MYEDGSLNVEEQIVVHSIGLKMRVNAIEDDTVDPLIIARNLLGAREPSLREVQGRWVQALVR